MKSSYLIATVKNIPIRVHITLLALIPFFAIQLGGAFPRSSIIWGLFAVIGVFASVALHELGHSIAALQKKINVSEIVLLPIGGIAKLTRSPATAKDELIIAAAGPAVSLGLGILFIAGSLLVAPLGQPFLSSLVQILAAINIMLVLFNLIPSFPMDGGRIFRALMTPKLGRLKATYIASRLGKVICVGFGIWGLFSMNLMLVAIAVFIFLAAEAEYRMVQMEKAMEQPTPFFQFGNEVSWTEINRDFKASPPPYAKQDSTTRIHAHKRGGIADLFNDLCENFKSK